MKLIYQLIIALVVCIGLTACATDEPDLTGVQPFLEGPWGQTYVDPPPAPPPPELLPPAEPVPVATPRPEPQLEATVAAAPEKEKRFGLFGRKKKEPVSETADAVQVDEIEIDVITVDEPTPAPTPTSASRPASSPDSEVTATLVPEPQKEKRFSFFRRSKEPVVENEAEIGNVSPAKSHPNAPLPTISFVDDIKPIFQEKCVSCHNRDTLHGRVSLESRQLAFQAGPAGPFIVPGNPEGSLLMQNVVTSKTSENAMPPVGHRVTRKEKNLLYAWIMEGAQWPDGPSGKIKPDVIARE